MRRLAIATSSAHPQFHVDDAPLLAALPPAGFVAEACVWNDPAVPWADYDAILVRTIWDYYRHYAEYLSWLARIDHCAVPVFNPVRTLRWNADKRYLLDLRAAGVDTIPSLIATRGTLAEALRDSPWQDVVIKPTISAGAWRTLRTTTSDLAAHEPAFAELLAQSPALLQPYVPEIESAGEWSLLYLGGEYSHAVLKRPRAGDFRVQEKHGGAHLVATPDATTIAQGQAVIRALAAIGHGGCIYARVDGVVVEGRLRLMEIELIEPQLFLSEQPAGGARLTRALASALSR